MEMTGTDNIIHTVMLESATHHLSLASKPGWCSNGVSYEKYVAASRPCEHCKQRDKPNQSVVLSSALVVLSCIPLHNVIGARSGNQR